MPLQLLEYVLNSNIVYALLWTLIHSLWQGLLIALIAAWLINITKKSAAIIRYKFLGILMCCLLLISIFTFFYEFNSTTSFAYNQTSVNTSDNFIINTLAVKPSQYFISKAIAYTQPYKNYLVIIWLMVVLFKCINVLADLRQIYRLKSKYVFDAGECWNNRLKELMVKLGITKPVIFLKSAIAEIPMTAGCFKPVILFPVAALTSLPPADIEAILLHELAHIRRNDYLLNIFQSFVEIIFFFNPAVLWLSSLIKEERESCCDDIALHQTKNKKQFIHALVAFKDHRAVLQQAALFSGNRYPLLNRLKRIITNNNKTLNNMEKTFLAAGIIITVFTTVAFTKIKKPLFTNTSHTTEYVKPSSFIIKKDTTEPTEVSNDESKTVFSSSVNGRQYKLVEMNGKTEELYVDGIKVPNDKLSDYSDVIKKLKQQLADAKQNNVNEMKAEAEALSAQSEALKANDIAMETQENLEKTKELRATINNSVKKEISTAEIAALNDQAEALKQQAEQMQAYNESKIDDAQKEEYKAQAEEYAKQAQALKNEIQNEYTQPKAEALKAQKDYIVQQNLYKKEALNKQMEQLKADQKNLDQQSEIMKQQQLQMKVEMDKATEAIKQQQIQMKADLEKQNEQLKEQNEKLIKQLNIERDSINSAKPVRPDN